MVRNMKLGSNFFIFTSVKANGRQLLHLKPRARPKKCSAILRDRPITVTSIYIGNTVCNNGLSHYIIITYRIGNRRFECFSTIQWFGRYYYFCNQIDVFCNSADPTMGSIIYVNKLSHGSRPCPLDPDPGEKIPIEIY